MDFDLEKQQEIPENTGILNQNFRLQFVRKVYGILSCQLLFTALICIISMCSKSFLNFQMQYTGLMLFFAILVIIITILLLCFRSIARKYPLNYIMLFIFTLSEAYMVSFTCGATEDPQLVMMAAIMTAVIIGLTIGLTIYAYWTKNDITMYGGLLFISCLVLIFMLIFISIFGASKITRIIACGFCIILYGMYLIYDTQLIAGGRKYELSLDDYIIGALVYFTEFIKWLRYYISM